MSNRGSEIKVSLRERIAALGLEGHATGSSSSSSNTNQHITTYSTGANSSSVAGVRDKAARFESIGGVPVPRGSFGLGAPPAFSNSRKAGELYGNRIPSGGRSPGSSPSRTLADEYVPTEFTRIKLRSIGSTGSLGDNGEPDSPDTRIQVVPPTPAFAPPEFSPKKEVLAIKETIPSPESVTAQPKQADAEQTPEPSQSTDKAQDVEIPENIPRSQELDSIPESPITDQVTAPSTAPTSKASTASKRRSLVLKNSTQSSSSRSSIMSPDRPSSPQSSAGGSVSTRRSAALSPPTGSPRKARSQAPSRTSSVSSTTSVFTSPPSDKGEVSGGGIPGSPTLETVDVDEWRTDVDDLLTKLDSDQDPDAQMDNLNDTNLVVSPKPSAIAEGVPERTEITATSIERDTQLVMNNAAASQVAYDENAVGNAPYFSSSNPLDLRLDILPTQSLPSQPTQGSTASEADSLVSMSGTVADVMLDGPALSPVETSVVTTSVSEKFTDSANDLSTPVKDRRDLLAETASPARVMRELRQLGMEKQSSVVIVTPRRASVLSMMMPSVATDSGVSHDGNRTREGRKDMQETETPSRSRPNHVGSPSTELPYLVQGMEQYNTAQTGSVQSPSKNTTPDILQGSREASPTTASIMSISQSFSGTSDASHPRLSFSSSLREMVSPPPPIPDSEPARPSSEYTPSFLAPPSPHSNVPFISTTQDDDRTMTPSPPPSFRSLYAAGRLPPSSRGPGPHLPSGKIPLLQRAVTLMSRSLPPLTKEELPPRRSSSAFNAIRSRTSSKAKREQAKAVARANASERSSTSSDMTITADLPPKLELHEPRPRTKSSPLVISTSHSTAPPVPPLPPIVISGDNPSTPPIARMFMERRVDATKSDASHSQPPTAYRPTSPTPSMSSAQASMSSCAGHPSRLFTPSFDDGIFDAFPEVPGHLPSSSVVARHSKLMAAGAGGRGHLGMLPNRSFSELEDHMTNSYSGRTEPLKAQAQDDSKATESNAVSPIRRKAPSRKQIPGWYDEDDDEGGTETGWASVQVIRSRLM